MSGIAALLHDGARRADGRVLERMLEAMAHRGPDGAAQWLDGPVALGHAMRHTTPESLRERQPVSDGTRWLVWDGRLDNRYQLLDALRAGGIGAGSETDPELVLAAYRVWGRACVERLAGEFAFLIWDAGTRTLFGARDRIGLKPFYYCRHGGRWLVASEAKGILAVLERAPQPDDELVLAALLSECREADNHRSLFAGIRRLPPGHVLIVRDGSWNVERYWRVDPHRQIVRAHPQEYVDEFAALFREAVACRTRSAFPVGSLLSGGLDSSAITATAASGGAALEAFSVFSEDSAADERLREEKSGDKRDENGEWLRDQTGEDHNLSGSSTYRTLPDQPESDKKSGDSSDRQSNR